MAKKGNIVVTRPREVEKSFVLKPGEGLNNCNLITHKVIHVDQSPRPSSVQIPKSSGNEPKSSKYASPMARARQETKRRGGGESLGNSKDWPNLSDMDSSSNPPSESGISVGDTPSRPVPYSGYIAKPRGSVSTADGEDSAGNSRLPKFGVWDNNNESSGPCYTLLFQNASQEKKVGGPVRIHVPPPCSPAQEGDLYSYHSGMAKSKRKNQCSLLCCFAMR
uniref:RIN4 pathogenic type III effector avirulence factor Avr cleavage site domain-containing protein n=1 Tax=Physcomitrium patens TaxID=3218 RepID=A0A2K1L6U1_PHYPA|nr:hypothetical protein PHYPA_000147 [Physcomitrium patens]